MEASSWRSVNSIEVTQEPTPALSHPYTPLTGVLGGFPLRSMPFEGPKTGFLTPKSPFLGVFDPF